MSSKQTPTTGTSTRHWLPRWRFVGGFYMLVCAAVFVAVNWPGPEPRIAGWLIGIPTIALAYACTLPVLFGLYDWLQRRFPAPPADGVIHEQPPARRRRR